MVLLFQVPTVSKSGSMVDTRKQIASQTLPSSRTVRRATVHSGNPGSRTLRVRQSTIVVWIVAVACPITYLLLLPALASVSPFGTFPFAAPLTATDKSISRYLKNAPANGGFAAFTSPVIAYAWLNPLARDALLVRIGAAFFTAGWLLSILIPVGFSDGTAHSAAFAVAVAGTTLFSCALTLRVQRSVVVYALLFLLLGTLALSAGLFAMSDIAFLVSEYVVAALTVLYAPALNLIGTPVARDTSTRGH
jgi:hypothetical protein